MNKNVTATAGAVGAMLLVVGGIVAAQASHQPAPHQQVRFVSPAADTVSPTVSTTTAAPAPTTPAPSPTKTVAPKPAPVQSVKAVAPAPAPKVQQRMAVVAPADPAPAPADTQPAPTPGQPVVPLDPNVGPTGQFGPGQGTPTPTK